MIICAFDVLTIPLVEGEQQLPDIKVLMVALSYFLPFSVEIDQRGKD